jgi:hypothetical protein
VTTPNPALIAAVPYLSSAIDELTAFVNTVMTGDPLQIPVRIDAAAKIFAGQVELLAAPLLTAEVGVVQTDITTALAGLKAKLQAAAAK